jgi:hypothetical protein
MMLNVNQKMKHHSSNSVNYHEEILCHYVGYYRTGNHHKSNISFFTQDKSDKELRQSLQFYSAL